MKSAMPWFMRTMYQFNKVAQGRLQDAPSCGYNVSMINQTKSMSSTPLADALIDDELFITPYTDACYDEAEVIETFDELSGDEYADAMMRELGLM